MSGNAARSQQLVQVRVVFFSVGNMLIDHPAENQIKAALHLEGNSICRQIANPAAIHVICFVQFSRADIVGGVAKSSRRHSVCIQSRVGARTNLQHMHTAKSLNDRANPLLCPIPPRKVVDRLKPDRSSCDVAYIGPTAGPITEIENRVLIRIGINRGRSQRCRTATLLPIPDSRHSSWVL